MGEDSDTEIHDDGKRCNTCGLETVKCSCQRDFKAQKTIHSAIKPPDFCKTKEDLILYERKLKRWSRSCGIPLEDQGDAILLHQSITNPTLQERLDKEIGDEMQDNKDCIGLLLRTIKNWYGIDKGVDLINAFNVFVNIKRNIEQDFHSYVGDFESRYSSLEKSGEKLSPRLLALFLLKNANLTDVEFQIITSNLDFSSDPKAKGSVQDLYQMTKDALNKYQNCRVINSNNDNLDGKTLLLNTSNLDALSEDQQKQVVLWASKKQKSEGNAGEEPPQKKWKKCYHCLCKCLPKWKKCDCPCSQHPPWKCPQKREKKNNEELESGAIASLSSGMVRNSPAPQGGQQLSDTADINLKNLSGYVNGRIKKIPRQKVSKNSEEVIPINHDLTLLTRKDTLRSEISKGKHDVTIDTACPTSLVGAKYFKKIFQSYPSSISSQFKLEPSKRTFMFGGSETTRSLGKYTFPVYVMCHSFY